MRYTIAAFMLVFITAGAQGAPDSNVGNEAFWSGDYTAAAAAYTEVTTAHPRSADGWFNLGTALVNAGTYGRAIHALSQALLLDPSHVDALYNLDRAEASAMEQALTRGGAEKVVLPGGSDTQTGIFTAVSSGLLHAAFALSWTLLFGLLALRRRTNHPARRTLLTSGAVLAALLALPSLGLIAGKRLLVDPAHYAVVVADEAPLRAGPGDQYPVQVLVLGGVKVQTRGADEGWVQVALPGGGEGWLPEQQLARLTP